MDLDFLLGRYKWELERKDKITSAVGFPTTILIFLGSLLVAMVRYPNLPPLTFSIAFVVVGSVATGVMANCPYWLSRAYRGSTYIYLPKLLELQEYLEDLALPDSSSEDADADFEAMFRLRIMDATDNNTTSNDERQAYLDRGLILSVILTALCGVFYVLQQIV